MQLTEHASVVELADARDSKSRVRKNVRVRPPPLAPQAHRNFDRITVGFFVIYCSMGCIMVK